jgi:hypothetical protein
MPLPSRRETFFQTLRPASSFRLRSDWIVRSTARASRAPHVVSQGAVLAQASNAMPCRRRIAAEHPTSMIVLEIALIVLSIIFFALMDRYAAGCEKI